MSEYLAENINTFNLTEEGIKLLSEKLTEVDLKDHICAIDELNEYCIYLMNTFSIKDKDEVIEEKRKLNR